MRDREGRPHKLKVGLKYCGGCRAGYDRVKTVEYIRERLGETIEFVPPDSEESTCILVVAGCKTACVDIAPFGRRPVRYITSEEDAARFIAEMSKKE